jgi:hypothetical protein
MPFGLYEILSNWSVPIGSAATVIGLAAIAFFLLRRRVSPDEAERLRRLDVGAHGRLLEGMVTDVHENTVYFTYSVRGVEYQAAQDLSRLLDRVPGEMHTLIGPITLKYITNNPANSVVLCEQWSGLRNAER